MAARPELENGGTAIHSSAFSPDSEQDEMSSLRHQLSEKAGGVMAALDRLRSLQLADLQLHFPRIIAIGPESCGKSSVLERLAHCSLFPRGEGICTRMPIELRLIHHSPSELKSFCLENKLTYRENETYCRMTYEKVGHAEPVKTTKYMKLSNMQKEVKSSHDKFIREVNGELKGIIKDTLVLEVYSSLVVNLRLVDLPGIIQASREGEPSDICSQTTLLTESYLKQPHTLVLGVVSATEGFRTSTAMGLVQKFKKQKDTIGVLTKADRAEDSRPEARRNPFRELKAKLDGTSPDMIPLPGVVATRNRDTYYDGQLHFEQVTRREKTWFDKVMPGYRMEKKVGIDALSEKLVSLLLRYTIETWAPDSLQKINTLLEKHQSDLEKECGLPPPQTEPEATKYLETLLQPAYRYWQDMDFFNPEGWISRNCLPYPEIIRESRREIFSTVSWKEFKNGVMSFLRNLDTLFEQWVQIILRHWLAPFQLDFAPASRLFPFRFQNLQRAIAQLLPLRVGEEVKARSNSQVQQLFNWYDSLPNERQHVHPRLRYLLNTIFFEDVFLIVAPQRVEVASQLQKYSSIDLLIESDDWIRKRESHKTVIRKIQDADAQIRKMISDARPDSSPSRGKVQGSPGRRRVKPNIKY